MPSWAWRLATDPADGLERRTEPADRTKAIAVSSLERLFRRQDVALREKCLWRLLYETAARAEEVLSADVGDLEVENKRLRVVRKGGDTDWLFFQSGSARLLPRLIGDRDAGPVFLAERRPGPARAPAALDLCPVTGRGRLSYERAEYLFKQHSFKVAKQGWTLHRLRHSALTHLAEAGVNLPLLMAKSGHQSLRSLQRYARPGAEAVAAMSGDPDGDWATGHSSAQPDDKSCKNRQCRHREETRRDHPPPQQAPIYFDENGNRVVFVPAGPPAPKKTNGFAIAALVLGLIWGYGIGSVLALIFGFIAKKQIKESNGTMGGNGLAIAGIVLGFVGIFAVIAFGAFGVASSSASGY